MSTPNEIASNRLPQNCWELNLAKLYMNRQKKTVAGKSSNRQMLEKSKKSNENQTITDTKLQSM